jgi:hypothetical protein
LIQGFKFVKVAETFVSNLQELDNAVMLVLKGCMTCPIIDVVNSLVPGLLTPSCQGGTGTKSSDSNEVICFLKKPILTLLVIREENSPQILTPDFF